MSEPSLGELIFSALASFHAEDDEDDHLRTYCEALALPAELVYSIIAPREDGAGWERMLDPYGCPAGVLPFLAQWVGVEIQPEWSEAQTRAEIAEPTSWKRGQKPSMETAAKRHLTGSALLILNENVPEVGVLYARTLLVETPDPALTEADIESQKPAWMVLDYEAISGVSWADVAASTKWTTVADLAAAFPTVKALTEILPSEL